MTNRKPLPTVRTSLSHPLQIATLNVGERGGAIGVTFAPGKHQAISMTGGWNRDLAEDLSVIRTWGASTLITLLEPFEFEELGITALPKRAEEFGLRWHPLPITDGRAPDQRFLDPWRALEPELINELEAGDRAVVHCKGGLGRAGTVACMILLSSGTAQRPDEAIARVRAVRPGAVETLEQEEFLRNWPVAGLNG